MILIWLQILILKKVCEVLKENKIDYYETGIEHGTITALIEGYKFEITSLREDILTDGRHAKSEIFKKLERGCIKKGFTSIPFTRMKMETCSILLRVKKT